MKINRRQLFESFAATIAGLCWWKRPILDTAPDFVFIGSGGIWGLYRNGPPRLLNGLVRAGKHTRFIVTKPRTGLSMYWHGQAPFVKIDIPERWPWDKEFSVSKSAPDGPTMRELEKKFGINGVLPWYGA